MGVARRIKDYIEANGLKQKYVAEKSGMSISVLNSILNGKSTLSVEKMERICMALGVTSDFFLEKKS